MSKKSKTPRENVEKKPVSPPSEAKWFLHDLWIAPLLFAIVFCSFLPSLKNGFVGWDDSGMFLENIEYRGLGWANIKWMFTTFHYAHYHPITWLTLGLDFKIWEMNPKGYHLTSLIIHSLNAVLFYLLIRMVIKVARASRLHGAGGTSSINEIPGLLLSFCCAIGASFYAIHPLRVESVAWATERRDVLSGFFYLLTFIAYIRAQTTAARITWLALSVIFFLLSFLSKAWGITLPLVLLILDVYPLRRVNWSEKLLPQIARLCVEKVPFFLIAITLAVVAYLGQKKWGIESENLTLLKRVAISVYGLCFYLWKTIVPLNLSPLYGLPKDLNPFGAQYLLCGMVLLAVTITLIVFRKRWPGALAAWLCYGLIVSPVIGLTQKGDQIAADRYTYLCLLPFAVLVAGGLVRFFSTPSIGKNLKTVFAVMPCAVVAGLSFLTFQQTKIWLNDFSLWERAVKVEPNNAIARNGRGKYLMDRGDWNGALADFNEAIRLNPRIVSARNNRGMVHYNKGDLAAALEDFQAALKIKPQHEIYNNCGAIYEVRDDFKNAIKHYSYAIQFSPNYSVGYFNRARARKHEGDYQGALEDFNASVKWDPYYAEAYFRRGDLIAQHFDAAKAMDDYTTALKLAPPNWQYRSQVEERIAQVRAQLKSR